MSNVPDGAQRSEDGNYWWDGSAWQLITADTVAAADTGHSGAPTITENHFSQAMQAAEGQPTEA